MPACTFFGHHDCPSTLMYPLKQVLITLIEEYSVNTFYIGNHGTFDRIAFSVLDELSKTYPHIRFSVVLAYLPSVWQESLSCLPSLTIYPEGIEDVPKRFAISWRNRWMLQRSDYVVTYITHSWGGAAQFAAMAKKQGKTMIPLMTTTNYI